MRKVLGILDLLMILPICFCPPKYLSACYLPAMYHSIIHLGGGSNTAALGCNALMDFCLKIINRLSQWMQKKVQKKDSTKYYCWLIVCSWISFSHGGMLWALTN